MMKVKYLLLAIGILFSVSLIGQKKYKGYSKSKRQTPASMLTQAQKLSDNSPTEAIKIIEQLVANKKDKTTYGLLDEAYFLLGKIYEDIDQNELAKQRYNEALSYTSKSDNDQKALIHYRLGVIALEQKDSKVAEVNFNYGLDFSSNPQQMYKFETGKIDILILNNQNETALNELALLESKNK